MTDDPTEIIPSAVDLTGIRDMLHEFTSGDPSRDTVYNLLQDYRIMERINLANGMEEQIRRTPGRKAVTNVLGNNQLTPEEKIRVGDAVATITYKHNETTIRDLIKSEFKRYMDFPVPKLREEEAANGTVKTFDNYFTKGMALVDALHKGEGISAEDTGFLKAFSRRILAIGTIDRSLLIPPELLFMASDKTVRSPIWERLERFEGTELAVKRFDALLHAALNHESLMNDALKARRKAKVAEEDISLPPFTLPTTDKAVFNAITCADWQVKTDADGFRDPFGGEDARTAVKTSTMMATIDLPTGLISVQPLYDLAKTPELSSLVISVVASRTPFDLSILYHMEIPRSVYDAKISPVTDSSLLLLKREKAIDLADANINFAVTDGQLPTLQKRLDALKIPCEAQSGLTSFTIPADLYKNPLIQRTFAPLIDKGLLRLANNKKKPDEIRIESTDSLPQGVFDDLLTALRTVDPKNGYTTARSHYLIFEPKIYEQQLAPVIKNLDKQKLGSLFPEAVREAAEQAVSMQSPIAGIPLSALPPLRKKSAVRSA